MITFNGERLVPIGSLWICTYNRFNPGRTLEYECPCGKSSVFEKPVGFDYCVEISCPDCAKKYVAVECGENVWDLRLK